MIWFQLALFVGSFLLSALLAPKPQIEDARAPTLDPEQFPRATEDAPCVLVLGCWRLKGPNTLWYGNYDPQPIRERVSAGLFSSKSVIVGYEIFLSIDLGLCLGPAELKEIYIDSEPVDPGLTSSFDEDFEFVDEEETGTTSWSGASSNLQTGLLTYSESYGASPATSGRGFTEFDLVSDFGLQAANIDGGNLTWEQEIGSNFGNGSIGSDSMTLFIRVKFFNASAVEIFSPDGVSAQTGSATYSPNTGRQLLTFDCLIPVGARTVEVTAWHATLFPIFSGQAFGDHRITIKGPNRVYTTQSFSINEPELFGGRKQGGGWIGNVTFYPGTFDQAVDTHVEESVSPVAVPAYRGLAHLVFENNNIGEQATLRRMSFLMSAITDDLRLSTAGLAFSGSDDINPAEAMYHILTDAWRGLKVPPAKINLASFVAAGETLITEQLAGRLGSTAGKGRSSRTSSAGRRYFCREPGRRDRPQADPRRLYAGLAHDLRRG